MMASRLLKLRLTRLHYEHAPKDIKDRYLPVVVAAPSEPQPANAVIPDYRLPPVIEPCAQPLKVIVETVAHDFNVPSWKILGSQQTWDLVVPRHIAMYLAINFSTLSQAAIGRYFRRDHTVIGHARDKIRRAMAEDERVNERVQALWLRLASRPNMPAPEEIQQRRQQASLKARRDRDAVSCA